MQTKSTYWLEKVLKIISLYVNALLCTLQHIVIHAMQISGVNSENLISYTESETYAHVGLRNGGPVFRAPPCRTASPYDGRKIGRKGMNEQ